MSISPVGGTSAAQMAQLYRQQMLSGTGMGDASGSAGASTAVDAGTAARSADFAGAIGQGLQQVASLDQTAASQAVQAATGNLTDIHDYVIAATQAQTATELTTTVRNKAVDAFNEIMRMPL